MDVISPDLHRSLHSYVQRFNACDSEIYPTDISNEDAEDFLLNQIPLLECPDKELEEIYYFRWWVFRKHIKSTPFGHIVTEFLPHVPWSGPENSIVCSACFHIREGRWMADPDGFIEEYIRFWLDGHGDSLAYSSWLAHSVWEYCNLKGSYDLGVQLLPQLTSLFRRREASHVQPCGLYWSNDDRDGMEYTISGSGFRPTLNSYAWADAVAISRFAKLAGQLKLSQEFEIKAEQLEHKINSLLWDDSFYRTLPVEDLNNLRQNQPFITSDVKELSGFIPWYFNLPNTDGSAFDLLNDSNTFYSPFGLTTAEQNHPQFMKEFPHECLWNGPVWPFATSQVLVAATNHLRNGIPSNFTKDDYYKLLLQYARSQHITLEDGRFIPWIDEDIDPYTGRWIARDILHGAGWPDNLGGYERGKDYNHSLFCDLILSGLLGISVEDNRFVSHPLIPDNWDYFRVEGLHLNGKLYGIYYDKMGIHYPFGAGLSVTELSK